MWKMLALAMAAGALASVPLGAQQTTPLKIPRLLAPVQLDGRSDEAAWQAAAPLEMAMHRPTYRGTPTERTEVRVGHDDAFLYVAARMFDSEPEKIQASSMKRDNMALTNDWFCFDLDTFNDKENLLAFCTTPAGLRADFAVFDDAQGSAFPANRDWNTFWDVAVSRDGEGWFAEMRIPFSSLRFQDQGGVVRMGAIAWRYIPRKNESVIYPAIPPEWGFWSQFKPSQAAPVELERVAARAPLYVTPYVLGGYQRSARLNGGRSGYDQTGDASREVGLDVKYGITSNLTLDLTYNTDFAQVEADDQQVNLTRFSLFYPEKRQFFQERASILSFNTGGPNRLFYSRRIGLNAGTPVPIHGGARLIGRVGDWDVGMLNMQTAAVEGLGSENAGVVRLRRQVFNPNSWVGGMVTSRVGTGGQYNLAFGLDGSVRLFGNDYLAFAGAQTREDGRADGDPLDATRVYATWERRIDRGLGYVLSVSRSGAEYNPGLGFEGRHDYTRLGADLFHGRIPGSGSRVLQHKLTAGRQVFLRNRDRSLESGQWAAEWEISGKGGWESALVLQRATEDLKSPFRIAAESTIPAGRYTFHSVSGLYGSSNGGMRGMQVGAEIGSFYDGWLSAVQLMPRWTLSELLTVGGSYQLNRVRFPDRREGFDAHVARLRAEATLNTRLSAAGFVQYSSAADAMGVNLRVRYNAREGNDIYLVYNEGVNTDLQRALPHLPRSGSRALLIKYSHTFAPTLAR